VGILEQAHAVAGPHNHGVISGSRGPSLAVSRVSQAKDGTLMRPLLILHFARFGVVDKNAVTRRNQDLRSIFSNFKLCFAISLWKKMPQYGLVKVLPGL
jgi:hypothetical protein